MKSFYIFLSLLFVSLSVSAQSEWKIRLMPQIAFGTNNTVQRPNNNEGTRVQLDKDFDRSPDVSFSPRIELEYNYNRHHIIATMALLTDKFEGVTGKDIFYDGVLFNNGDYINTKYKFNTYRLGYRYRIVNHPRIAFELGATLLLRDAYISLDNGNQEAKYSNVGVAPLLSYYFEWNANDRFSLLTYGDAFAVKAGRAEDIFAGAKYQINDFLSATAGYRLLEGGSDGDRVYTMALFHFASVGIEFRF